jgi:hypothetical protein
MSCRRARTRRLRHLERFAIEWGLPVVAAVTGIVSAGIAFV